MLKHYITNVILSWSESESESETVLLPGMFSQTNEEFFLVEGATFGHDKQTTINTTERQQIM